MTIPASGIWFILNQFRQKVNEHLYDTQITLVSQKPDGSLVTNLDTSISEIARFYFVEEQYWKIASEESPSAEITTWQDCLDNSFESPLIIIDPVDGTYDASSLVELGGPSVGFFHGTQLVVLYKGELVASMVIDHHTSDYLTIVNGHGCILSSNGLTHPLFHPWYRKELAGGVGCFNYRYLQKYPLLNTIADDLVGVFNLPSIAATIRYMTTQSNVSLIAQEGMLWDILPLFHTGRSLGYRPLRLDTCEEYSIDLMGTASIWETPLPPLLLVRLSDEETITFGKEIDILSSLT